MTILTEKNKKTGKIFIIFVFLSFFASLILISNVFAKVLNVNILFASNAKVNSSSYSVYCICYGSYETENSALMQTEYLKSKGGAGFIYKFSENYSVILNAYLDKNVCKGILDKNTENFDNIHMETINISKSNYNFNKANLNTKPLKEIISLPLDIFNELHNLSNKYDSGEYLSSRIYNELFKLAYNINSKIENFKNKNNLINLKNYNQLLLNAQNIYSKVNNLILNTPKSELSQSIKYTSLDVLLINVSWHFIY